MPQIFKRNGHLSENQPSKNRWNTTLTCHSSRLTWPNYNPNKKKTLLQCNWKDISTTINALTGHCLLETHVRRLGLSNHDYCRSCKQIDEEESTEHFLCFCPAHNFKRLQTLDSYKLPNLADIQGVSIPKLLCFLRRINWLEKPMS